jgi:hypothetical protein
MPSALAVPPVVPPDVLATQLDQHFRILINIQLQRKTQTVYSSVSSKTVNPLVPLAFLLTRELRLITVIQGLRLSLLTRESRPSSAQAVSAQSHYSVSSRQSQIPVFQAPHIKYTDTNRTLPFPQTTNYSSNGQSTLTPASTG